MPIVLMKIGDLGSRGEEVRKMLRPISKIEGGPAWSRKGNPREFIIAIHDGAQPTSEYRDWRFSTIVPNFNAMYFELWKRTEEDEGNWYLDRAYFSLYQLISREEREKEFLCLHCDPNISSELEEFETEHEKTSNKVSSQSNKKSPKKKNLKQLMHEAVKLDKPDKDKYKKGPHLHIKAADDPLPHAHFALNLGHLDAVLESIETLSEAMRCAIFMLKEEVLDTLLTQQ